MNYFAGPIELVPESYNNKISILTIALYASVALLVGFRYLQVLWLRRASLSKIIKLFVIAAPLVGLFSGIYAFLYNDGQKAYLFSYPIAVTFILETMAGVWVKYKVPSKPR